MILTDDHLHTNFSDGKDSPQNMVETAIACGFNQITFTDHVRVSSDWVEEYCEVIKRLQEKYRDQIAIKIGVECKIVDFNGTLDCPQSVLIDKGIEKVAAIHRIPDGKGSFISRDNISENVSYAKKCYIRAVEGISSNKHLSRLAHPFSLFPYMDVHDSQNEFWNAILKAINEVKKPIEYNIKYDNSIVPNSIWTNADIPVIFGSDSHSTEELYERSRLLKKYEHLWKSI